MKKTQPFYLDDKYIGEIPITGDEKQDIKNAKKLLAEKGLNKKVKELDSMIQQATAFANLALEIYNQRLNKLPPITFFAAPFVVNSTFSIEVYIKSLAFLTEQRKIKGHSIWKLYESLNDDVKQTLLDISDQLNKIHNVEDKLNLEELLKDIDNAFINWRYLYEKPPGMVNFTSICLIIKVFQETIKRLKAE